MPGDGPADGNKVARFAVDLPGFLRWLSAAREGPSCLSDPESPKVAKSRKPSESVEAIRGYGTILSNGGKDERRGIA
jgi:hypothetical protein